MGEFCNFIVGFIENYYQEQVDKQIWDLFVHSYTDKTFEEFKKEKLKPKPKPPTEAELQATLNHSRDILKRFNTSNKGGE